MSIDRCQDLLNRPQPLRAAEEAEQVEEPALATAEHQLGQALWRARGSDAEVVKLLQGLPRVQRLLGRVMAIRRLGAARGAELSNRAFGAEPLRWGRAARASAQEIYQAARARGAREVLAALLRGEQRPARQVYAEMLAEPSRYAAMMGAAERRAAMIFRREAETGDADPDHPAVREALGRAGSGAPLPDAVQRESEARFGVSFAPVRVHTDAVAARAARAIRARAFTVGEDIFFAEGAFAPETAAGRELLAHELTHVVQAYAGRVRVTSGAVQISQPGDALEREAAAAAGAAPSRPGGSGARAPVFRTRPAEGGGTVLHRAEAPRDPKPQPEASESVDQLRQRQLLAIVQEFVKLLEKKTKDGHEGITLILMPYGADGKEIAAGFSTLAKSPNPGPPRITAQLYEDLVACVVTYQPGTIRTIEFRRNSQGQMTFQRMQTQEEQPERRVAPTEQEELNKLGILTRGQIYGGIFHDTGVKLKEVGLQIAAVSGEVLVSLVEQWVGGQILGRVLGLLPKGVGFLRKLWFGKKLDAAKLAKHIAELGPTEAKELVALTKRLESEGKLTQEELKRLEELWAKVSQRYEKASMEAAKAKAAVGNSRVQRVIDFFGKEVVEAPRQIAGTDIDVVLTGKRFLEVGGAGKATKLEAFRTQLQKVLAYANQEGGSAWFYYDEGTPEVVLEVARKVLGAANVKPIP